ncbi:hypothetical protein FHX10_006743 [Rhizobium sp. BK591]|uniref:hypothetical protein n=1 Tax=Rhizobium sp. BK591 TaxID=2586985 RepID=UPI0013AFADF0|nr:hypothetical protein [Rhizobium sp. BK591]MBB3747187.1 hypothetical protein [Rhizobium sp. BK591]
MELLEHKHDEVATILRFSFSEPPSKWRALNVGELFTNLEKFAIELQIMQAMVDLDDELGAMKLPTGDLGLTLVALSSASLQRGLKMPTFENDVISFKYNSPVEVVVRVASSISEKTFKAALGALEFVMCRDAINRKKHAEASQEEQKALAMAIKNYQEGLKALQRIENPEFHRRFEQMLTESLTPLVDTKGPSLKSIDAVKFRTTDHIEHEK